MRGDLKRGRVQRRLWQLAQNVIPKGKGYDINQAMMDFGATVCMARAPKCPTCVLRHECRSYPLVEPKHAPKTTSARRRRRH